MTYPALCRVRPPRQLLFDGPVSERQFAHVVESFCFRVPHAHRLWLRHAGQRRWPLDGSKVRPHSVQTLVVITVLYQNLVLDDIKVSLILLPLLKMKCP